MAWLEMLLSRGETGQSEIFFLPQQMGDSLEVEECGDEGPGMKRRGRSTTCELPFFFFKLSFPLGPAAEVTVGTR